MCRALAAISALCAAVSALAGPPVADRPVDTAALSVSESAPMKPASTVPRAPAALPTAANTATAPTTTAGAEPNARPEAAPGPVPSSGVPQIALRKAADDTVCRKERPTGSLISVQRCYSRGSAAHRKDDELLRSDLDYIRRQENDRQAREAAAAMRDRRQGP